MKNKDENLKELFDLIEKYPDLPVVPMVYYEIVGDDTCSYWHGSWGKAKIDEYLVGKDRIHFKSDDDVFEVLEDYMEYGEYEKLPDEEDECRPYYDGLPWKKAIVVYIESPDGN